MDRIARIELHEFIRNLLANQGDRVELGDTDSLFVSGRLDSISMMSLVLHLEETFGIHFSRVDFDMARIDTLDAIDRFVTRAVQL